MPVHSYFVTRVMIHAGFIQAAVVSVGYVVAQQSGFIPVPGPWLATGFVAPAIAVRVALFAHLVADDTTNDGSGRSQTTVAVITTVSMTSAVSSSTVMTAPPV